MKKTRVEKGITLIALIITIVVLLILAAVAISSIQNDGILSYATNAAKEYNQAVANEQKMLNEYVNFLNNGSSGSGSGGGTIYTAYTVGQEVKVDVEGVEHAFYVIEDSSETEEMVILLAKAKINTTTLKQENANSLAFSSTNYWSTIEGITYPYDLVETGEPDESHYAAYAAYHYGKEVGGTGRLMTYAEANALRNTTVSSQIYETFMFWLGAAYGDEHVYYTISRGRFESAVSATKMLGTGVVRL